MESFTNTRKTGYATWGSYFKKKVNQFEQYEMSFI